MSTQFRDHCRRMAAAEHKPDCPSLGPPSGPVWESVYDADNTDGIPNALRLAGFTPKPPTCEGCNPAADRALFARLAGEVDDYLAPAVDLFGEVTVEPMTEEFGMDERKAVGHE